MLSSRDVDQRLVLCGYRPIELLLGRLLFPGPFGLVIAAGFATLTWAVSHPERPWLLFVGVAMVTLVSVPFGLAVGAAVPNELEGTLVLIGVVGMQLAASPDSIVAKVLPFYGPASSSTPAPGIRGRSPGPSCSARPTRSGSSSSPGCSSPGGSPWSATARSRCRDVAGPAHPQACALAGHKTSRAGLLPSSTWSSVPGSS